MKKLRLELDELAVKSFETSRMPGSSRGTVHGQSQPITNDPANCPGAIVSPLIFTAGDAFTCQFDLSCPLCEQNPVTLFGAVCVIDP